VPPLTVVGTLSAADANEDEGGGAVTSKTLPEGGCVVETGIGTELGDAPDAFTALTLYRYSVLGERLLTMSDVPNGIGLFV
jgi:hypothetical protein